MFVTVRIDGRSEMTYCNRLAHFSRCWNARFYDIFKECDKIILISSVLKVLVLLILKQIHQLIVSWKFHPFFVENFWNLLKMLEFRKKKAAFQFLWKSIKDKLLHNTLFLMNFSWNLQKSTKFQHVDDPFKYLSVCSLRTYDYLGKKLVNF